MLLRHRVPSTLLLLAGLVACDAADPRSCDVLANEAFRKLTANGQSLNGEHLNGYSTNGQSLNGENLNGVSMNGIALGDATIVAGVVAAELVGTALVATLPDGTVVAGEDWVGAVLQASVGGQRLELRIRAVERDTQDPTIEWYALELDGEPLCGEGGRGLFVAGVWDETAARHDALADAPDIAHTFSCATGAIAKCVTWGYTPYGAGVDAHQSCTRLARADYCGDGQAHTVDGTLVDVFDTLGVQESEASVDLAFEAGWGPDGATCVSRPRYLELDDDGEEIAVGCWDTLPACDDADEAIATGAALMSRSAPQTLCHG